MIPVFPLDGALLLPGGQLPLNIFEPRYLNMFDDAMSGERIIGMVQTRQGGDIERPNLAPGGLRGPGDQLRRDQRRPLSGHPDRGLPVPGRRRAAQPLALSPGARRLRRLRGRSARGGADRGLDRRRPRLLDALRRYLDHRGLAIDWSSAEAAPSDALINSLAMALPFEPVEKQALLEAPTLAERRETLVALLEIDAAGDDEDPTTIQ